MRPIRIFGKVLKYGLAALVIAVVLGLVWLRWESHLPREQWFKERHGNLIAAEYSVDTLSAGNLSERVTVTSDSGLKISFRVIRMVRISYVIESLFKLEPFIVLSPLSTR